MSQSLPSAPEVLVNEAPAAGDPAALPDYDHAACRELMRGGSRTFFAASLLLPPRVRAPATALYAFCRLADDEIDLGGDPQRAMQGLNARLDAIYAGRPQAIDADRALAGVVHRHGIPRALLDALLDGFLWDTQGRRYETIEDVHAYGARVAGAVGAMMTQVMLSTDSPDGARPTPAEAAQTLARACELGVAMQLTNIARDIGEDARNGRCYLPRQWLRDAGIDPDAWLAAPRFEAGIAEVTARLLAEADRLYARAEHGIAALPRDCRPAIQAARLVYAEIGRQIEQQGLDSIHRRAVVSGQRKLALIARAATAALRPPADGRSQPAPLAAITYLVDATVASAAPSAEASARRTRQPLPSPRAPRQPMWRSLDDRLTWVIELFERQAAEQRALR